MSHPRILAGLLAFAILASAMVVALRGGDEVQAAGAVAVTKQEPVAVPAIATLRTASVPALPKKKAKRRARRAAAAPVVRAGGGTGAPRPSAPVATPTPAYTPPARTYTPPARPRAPAPAPKPKAPSGGSSLGPTVVAPPE